MKGDKKIGFSNLDQLTPLEVATKVVKLLPALCNHLEGASGFFQVSSLTLLYSDLTLHNIACMNPVIVI